MPWTPAKYASHPVTTRTNPFGVWRKLLVANIDHAVQERLALVARQGATIFMLFSRRCLTGLTQKRLCPLFADGSGEGHIVRVRRLEFGATVR